jgi:hypothetical protein
MRLLDNGCDFRNPISQPRSGVSCFAAAVFRDGFGDAGKGKSDSLHPFSIGFRNPLESAGVKAKWPPVVAEASCLRALGTSIDIPRTNPRSNDSPPNIGHGQPLATKDFTDRLKAYPTADDSLFREATSGEQNPHRCGSGAGRRHSSRQIRSCGLPATGEIPHGLDRFGRHCQQFLDRLGPGKLGSVDQDQGSRERRRDRLAGGRIEDFPIETMRYSHRVVEDRGPTRQHECQFFLGSAGSRLGGGPFRFEGR